MGRVFFAGVDRRNGSSTFDRKLLYVNPLYSKSNIPTDLSILFDSPVAIQPHQVELAIIEDTEVVLEESQIMRREPSIYYNNEHGTPEYNESVRPESYVVCLRMNLRDQTCRPLQLAHPIRGELELDTFGRQWFLDNFLSECISMPFTLFLDAFGLYHNMYRSIMGIYMQPANITGHERSRRRNVFAVTLGPFGAKFSDVIDALSHLKELDRGMRMNINGKEVFVCGFTFFMIGDMPQQQSLSSCMSQNANFGCRSCLIHKNDRDNLDYNIVQNGRYHYPMIYLRRLHSRKKATARIAALKRLGMAEEESPIIRITPALDLISTRPADAAHSEYHGISKKALIVLLEDVIQKRFLGSFVHALNSIQFPPGWSRLQSPVTHINSYRMQEFARASVVIPVLMQLWLKEEHVVPKVLHALKTFMKDELRPRGLNGVDALIICLARIAKSNATLLSPSITAAQRQGLIVSGLAGRTAYQTILKAAAEGHKTRGKSTNRRGSVASIASSASGASSVGGEASEDDEDNIIQRVQAGPYQATGAKKVSELLQLTKTPNTHVMLHYLDVSNKFVTPRNCLTFSGEDKHR